MTSWLIVLALLLGVALGAVGWMYRDHTPIVVQMPASVPVAPVATGDGLVRPARKPELLTIRLVSNSGRMELGTVQIEAQRRRGSMEHRGTDGYLGQFSAWYVDEGGTWWYRRVGVARES